IHVVFTLGSLRTRSSALQSFRRSPLSHAHHINSGNIITHKWGVQMSLKRATSVFGLVAMGLSTSGGPAALAADPDHPTASPIKHVIIIVGENRSFDHLFATYVPKNGERVRNLLSEGIIKADGSQGPNFARARQFQITAPPNGSGNFFMSAGAS